MQIMTECECDRFPTLPSPPSPTLSGRGEGGPYCDSQPIIPRSGISLYTHHPHPPHPTRATIATSPLSIHVIAQNVAGIRTEAKRRGGPKLATIRSILKPTTDFLILTEIKAYKHHVNNCKITPVNTRSAHALLPTMCTNTVSASGGVCVFSKSNHELLENSFRESLLTGHYVLGVYKVGIHHVIIGGVYGLPDHNDLRSAAIFENLLDDVRELQSLFPVQNIMIAGDFNCVLSEKDSHMNIIRKPRTNQKIKQMIDELQLTDIAEITNRKKHTYYRNGDLKTSSRLDFVLSNITHDKIFYDSQPTIFDHHFVEAIISNEKTEKSEIRMKEYILKDPEFLDNFSAEISNLLSEYEDDNFSASPGPKEQNRQHLPSESEVDAYNKGLSKYQVNSLQLFMKIVQLTKLLHDQTYKAKQKQQRLALRDRRQRMHKILSEIKKSKDADKTRELTEEYTSLQNMIKNENEAKETASKIRIRNFYKENTGKNVPSTFYCTKNKKVNKDINELTNTDGQKTNDKNQIVRIMQEWYLNMANVEHEQSLSLDDFLTEYGINLPKISQEQSNNMAASISAQEIFESIKDAKEFSASGPTGQSIAMYKLLFSENPLLFTAAINQLAFVPGLANAEEYKWVKERKIIYIPKKSAKTYPTDFRPLSMLEVLYKIPARIIAKRLNSILPTIIGPHQHGFMPGKGIQEPSLAMLQIIQEANINKIPVQILSYDIENAFAKVSHTIILQSLRAFGVPEIIINFLKEYALIGYAKVEVNGKTGFLFLIKTGSGQGDPLSAVLYIIATEPCNRALAKISEKILFQSTLGIRFGIKLYADDSKIPLVLQNPANLQEIHELYEKYTKVSGLKINYKKSSALCINTSAEVEEYIAECGIPVVAESDCLGIILGKTVENSIERTLDKIDPKLVKKRIQATTPPTSMLHRAILINVAIQPIYNHVFMAMPVQQERIQHIFDEIFSLLWTRRKDGITIFKRKVVSKSRIFAGYEVGGLDIRSPTNTIKGFQQNLIQKMTKNPDLEMSQVLAAILDKIRRPSLQQHIDYLGPQQWLKSANKIKNYSLILSQAFEAIAEHLQIFENDTALWGHAPIFGHSEAAALCEFNIEDFKKLFEKGISLISHILQRDQLTGTFVKPPRLDDEVNRRLRLYPQLCFKLKIFVKKFTDLIKHDIRVGLNSALQQMVSRNRNMSQLFNKTCKKMAANNIDIAPAYNTRIRDRIDVPTKEEFKSAFFMIKHKYLPLKTKDNSLQTLNRTIWTNNKAFKSGLREDDQCRFCGETENMEHMYYLCQNYSNLQWELFASAVTVVVKKVNPNASNIYITFRNIIFNTPITNLFHYVKDKEVNILMGMLVHEIRRKIYAFRTSSDDSIMGEVHIVRRAAHILETLRKMESYLNYIKSGRWLTAIEAIGLMIDHIQTIIASE